MSSKWALEETIRETVEKKREADQKLALAENKCSRIEQENAKLKDFIGKLVDEHLGTYRFDAEMIENSKELDNFKVNFSNFKEFLDTGKEPTDATCLKDAFEKVTRSFVGGDNFCNLSKKFQPQIKAIESIIDQKHLEIVAEAKKESDSKLEKIYKLCEWGDTFNTTLFYANEALRFLGKSPCSIDEIRRIGATKADGWLSTKNIVSAVLSSRGEKA